jgi:hypothetical protein
MQIHRRKYHVLLLSLAFFYDGRRRFVATGLYAQNFHPVKHSKTEGNFYDGYRKEGNSEQG